MHHKIPSSMTQALHYCHTELIWGLSIIYGVVIMGNCTAECKLLNVQQYSACVIDSFWLGIVWCLYVAVFCLQAILILSAFFLCQPYFSYMVVFLTDIGGLWSTVGYYERVVKWCEYALMLHHAEKSRQTLIVYRLTTAYNIIIAQIWYAYMALEADTW